LAQQDADEQAFVGWNAQEEHIKPDDANFTDQQQDDEQEKMEYGGVDELLVVFGMI
jgi:hypothetical protein